MPSWVKLAARAPSPLNRREKVRCAWVFAAPTKEEIMPPTGREDVHPPEKQQHTQHLNAALAKALREWNPQDGTEVVIRFEASVSENPGGVHQYRAVLTPL
jgi:hypothetical protein